MANEKRLDLINKWDVVNKLSQLQNQYNFYKNEWDADVLYRRIVELEIGIGKTPTVDAVEVVHARWRWGYNSMNHYGAWCAECECGWEDKGTDDDFIRVQGLVIAHKYCPNCGAQMDGDGNGT